MSLIDISLFPVVPLPTMMDVLRLEGLFLITLTVYYCVVDASMPQVPFENITAGHELRKHILKNYDKVVVPATSKNPVQMEMTIVFNSIELSYDTSQMIINAWLKTEWNDNRLTWNPNDYDQIKFITVENYEIWLPDFMAYNNIQSNTIVERYPKSLVNCTGNVLWVQPVQYRIHYQADMTYWPYDTQAGVLKVGSWVYSVKVINLTKAGHEIEILNPNSEWKIAHVSSEEIIKIYSCCPEEPYSHVEYNFTINRRMSYKHHPVIFVPALSTALLNLLVFWISPNDKCKLTSSLLNALIVVVILLIMYSKMPLILSSFPLIVLYYTYSLVLIVLTAIISVSATNMTETPKPLSKQLNRIVQSRFVEFLGMEINQKPSSDTQVQYEDKELDIKHMEFNKRQRFAQIVDRICFIVFSFVYMVLLSRFVF